jgi:hypothetical protein
MATDLLPHQHTPRSYDILFRHSRSDPSLIIYSSFFNIGLKCESGMNPL